MLIKWKAIRNLSVAIAVGSLSIPVITLCRGGFRKHHHKFIYHDIMSEFVKEFDVDSFIDWAGIPKVEQVAHPTHYNAGSVEVIDMMERVFGVEKVMAFCELNAFKYRMRAGHKGDAMTDIRKAEWYEDKFNELKNK